MSWFYRLLKRNNEETSITLDSAIKHLYWGSTGTPNPLATADDKGVALYFSGTATSGTTYGEYIRLDGSGAGSEQIAGRHKVLLTGNGVGNAHGFHATLENDTTYGTITGLGTGLRANLVLANRSIGAGGTYYGAMVEVFSNGSSSSAAAATLVAVLGIGATGDATGAATVKNMFNFLGPDGTGNIIYTHTAAGTQHGTIRVLINGTPKWIPFMSAE